MTFNRNMLPTLGVSFHYFSNSNEAIAFADWAENETRNWEYPCEAFITTEYDRPSDERYEVKIRNW